MSRLIDAEKLDFVSYQGIPDGYKDSFDSGVLYAMNLIDEQQTVDAVPAVHGKWVKKEKIFEDGTTYGCSNCGGTPLRRYNAQIMSDYCPWCGAKMDEVTE